jgi:hypothetical protein
MIRKEKLKKLQGVLPTIEKLVLILPEGNNILPVGLES